MKYKNTWKSELFNDKRHNSCGNESGAHFPHLQCSLHNLHILCSAGIFICLPFSISSLCELIRNLVKMFLWLYVPYSNSWRTGQISVIFRSYFKMITYFIHLSNPICTGLVAEAFEASRKLHLENKRSWYRNITEVWCSKHLRNLK
jgi:hypothetical protein